MVHIGMLSRYFAIINCFLRFFQSNGMAFYDGYKGTVMVPVPICFVIVISVKDDGRKCKDIKKERPLKENRPNERRSGTSWS